MKRALVPLLFILAAVALPARACFNDYEPNVAAIERSQAVLAQLRPHAMKESWAARRDRLRARLAAGGDYRTKNDLATALAHTGAATDAVALLEQVEAEKPGLYGTAANLGTAYELTGDNARALEWIRQGIRRNADSHEGTEWLHVRILEAKVALQQDPKWLETHSVLGTRDKQGGVQMNVAGNRGEPLSPDQIKAALIYQLHERMQFVPPPEAIVGDLLVELGSLVGDEPASGYGGALGVYKLADGYLQGLPNVKPMQTTAESGYFYAQRQQRKPNPRAFPLADFALLCIVGIILALPVIALKRSLERRLAPSEKIPNREPQKEHLAKS